MTFVAKCQATYRFFLANHMYVCDPVILGSIVIIGTSHDNFNSTILQLIMIMLFYYSKEYFVSILMLISFKCHTINFVPLNSDTNFLIL